MVETTPPGAGPPPHWHTNEDEWFFVLEGRVSFLTDGMWHEVGPGGRSFHAEELGAWKRKPRSGCLCGIRNPTQLIASLERAKTGEPDPAAGPPTAHKLDLKNILRRMVLRRLQPLQFD